MMVMRGVTHPRSDLVDRAGRLNSEAIVIMSTMMRITKVSLLRPRLKPNNFIGFSHKISPETASAPGWSLRLVHTLK